MLSNFRAAPRTVRKLLAIAWAELVVLVGVQTWAFVGVYQRTMATLEDYDPFAGMAEAAPLPTVDAFVSSLAFSMPAGCVVAAVYLSGRIARPYRTNSRMLALVSAYAALLLAIATIAGVALGNRSLGAGTMGSLASLLFVMPVLPLLHHPTVRAWTRPIPVTPPDIDPNA